MPISVASRDSAVHATRPLVLGLAAIVREALASEGRRAGEVSILFARDSDLRELNRRWRGIDRATDVLSFPYAEERGRVDGDLVISLDRLHAQATRYRVTPGKELARLVVHGTLHLAGLDHHQASERLHMRRREARVMRAVAPRVAVLDRGLRRPKPRDD